MKTRIKELRKAFHLSQTEFGKCVGVSLSSVQKWESGENIPSLAVRYVICNKFGVSRSWLENGIGEMVHYLKESERITEMEDRLTLGERVKKIRLDLNLTQLEFGRRIGVSGATVSTTESGKTNPDNQTIQLICREYGVSRCWLETGQGEMKAPDPTTAQMVMRVMNGQNEYAKQVMAALASLDDSEWAALKGIMDKLKKAGL